MCEGVDLSWRGGIGMREHAVAPPGLACFHVFQGFASLTPGNDLAILRIGSKVCDEAGVRAIKACARPGRRCH